MIKREPFQNLYKANPCFNKPVGGKEVVKSENLMGIIQVMTGFSSDRHGKSKFALKNK